MRRSGGARRHGLHEQWSAAGCESFFDREGIGSGSHWRRQPNNSIAEANLLVWLVHERAIGQRWVAAELVTGLVGQRLTGILDVIVLTHPQLVGDRNLRSMPVLEIFTRTWSLLPPSSRPRIIPAAERTVRPWPNHSGLPVGRS